MDHQPREVRHCRRPVLLAALPGNEGHEIAERLGVVQELPQLHADPRGIHDAHVEREDPRESVQRARVMAREPDRIRARRAVGKLDLLQAQDELVAGRGVDHIHRPRERAVGAGARLVHAEHVVQHRRARRTLERAQPLAAPADHLRHRGNHAGNLAHLAVRRETHLERIVADGAREGVELHAQPFAIVRAHVHGERLGHGAEPARLLASVDPHLERECAPAFLHLADEEREPAERRLDHVRPGEVAFRHLRAARPAQAGEDRLRKRLDREAAIGAVHDHLACRRRLRGRIRREHRAQHGVRAIGRQALQARLPRLHVEAFEVRVRIIFRDVHGLRDAGVDEGRHRGHHRLVRVGADLQRGHEVIGQLRILAEHVAIQAPRMVLDPEFLVRAVGHALLARVRPRERRLDAVGCIVGEGEADGARGRDRKEVGIADAVLADGLLDRLRQARCEVAARKVKVLVEHRERAALLRQLDRRHICGVAHVLRDPRRHLARGLGVVLEPQHRQRIAETRISEAHAALGPGLLVLLRKRPRRDGEDVVQHADRHLDDPGERLEVESGCLRESPGDETREVDGTQAAASVRGEEFLRAGV